MPVESDPQLPPDPDYSGSGGVSGYGGGGGGAGGFFPAQPGEIAGGFGRLRKRGSLGGLQSYMNLPDIEGPKTGRNYPRPGGGPGAGGPGGRGGFGGFNPNLFRGESVGVDEGYLPIMLRKRGLQMPGVTPGAPGKSDTVPAMLTPGEVVMNRGVTQNPDLMQFLLQLNQQGAQQNPVSMSPGPQGFAEGGLVMEDDADETESGVAPESPALKFIRLLLALDGGEVEGFAQGGVAGFGQFGGGFGRSGKLGMGAFGRPPAQQGGTPAPVTQGGLQAGGAPPGGWTRDAEGNVTNYNPQNPWGNYGANQNPYGLGLLYRGVGQAGQAGAYDPRGNQQLVNQQIEAAQGTKDALVRRQMTAADVGGLDPAQQAVARLQALRETGRGVQDIAANVRAGAADRAQSFNEQMLTDLYRGGQQYNLADQQARNQQVIDRNRAKAGKDASGGFAGQLAGAALGGWAGGGFANPFGGRRP